MPGPEIVAAAAVVVALAYLVFGMVGFGSTVIALPLLAHAVPLRLAVPLMLLLDVAAFVASGPRLRQGVRYDELRWLVPLMLVGMLAGLGMLVRMPERLLLGVLGIFVLGYAALGLARRAGAPRLPRWAALPVGLVGGLFSALFGTGGVVFALYNAGRIGDPGELRASNAAMIALSALLRIVLFASAGLLAQDGLWGFALVLLPAVLVGMAAGKRLHDAVAATVAARAVHVVLLLSGASLIVRALS